jgi:hypothetical protein
MSVNTVARHGNCLFRSLGKIKLCAHANKTILNLRQYSLKVQRDLRHYKKNRQINFVQF